MNFILLFLAGCTFLQLFIVYANEYLDEKLRQSKIEIIKIHIQETSPVQEKLYRIHWDELWRVPLTGDHQPFTINMFDGIFILDGNRVMAPSFNENSSNKTLVLRKVDHIEEYPLTVKFVKSVVWKNTTTYLLVCYEVGLCNLHTGTRNDSLRFRHTIEYQENPVDAKFFIHNDGVYLVIANNAKKFSVPSFIYRWSGTYMDVVDEIMTIGAESVTTFKHRQSTIIVFAQSNAENLRVGSEVYEFKDNNIIRIQFLLTRRPISVHHYVHGDFNFILMINDLEPSSVLCWDGRELLDWFSLPEIQPRSLINIFHMDGDTFIVVAYDNIVQLYKFHSTSEWKTEDTKRFRNDQKITDITVSTNKYTMTVMLVIKQKNVYWVEQWKIEMTSVSSRNIMRDADETRKCLSDMIEVLQKRMPAVKEAEASWEFLLSTAKNLTLSQPVKFNNLILQSGMVENIEVEIEEEEILPPYQIQQALSKLDSDIEEISLKWQKLVNKTILDILNGKKTINDAFLEEFKIDWTHVDFINDMDTRSEMLLPKDKQQFASLLRAKRVVIHNFEVDSLCGIPFQYWTYQNNTSNILTAANGLIEYSNDTVIVHSDLAIQNLVVKNLNGTIIDQLIDDLFVINHSQIIKGQITYMNSLKIVNFTTKMLNGISADKLMTTTTNQSFDDFHVKILEINNLHAEMINGIPVKEAARKSRKNVIKGKINLAILHVIKNLDINMNASIMKSPEEPPLQIYENVTILGNLHLRNVEIWEKAALFMENVTVNMSNIFNNFWTKSSNQTIMEKITFEDGLTIDKLNTKYLNGFEESDFLYITTEEILSDFANLHFENFHVNDSFFNDHHDIFFHVKSEPLTINGVLHLQNLRTTDIITLTFNGINLSNIMYSTNRINFSKNIKLPTVQANRVLVDNLNLRFLNNREIYFEDGLRVYDDYKIDTLKVPEFHVQNLELEILNSEYLNSTLMKMTRLKDLMNSNLNELIIEGNLIVGNLKVDRIDNKSAETYLEKLALQNIIIPSKEKIEDLVVQNIMLESLHGQNFDAFVANVLSKSKKQVIPGHFLADIIISDNVTTNFINGQNASQLIWVDAPLTIMGNITFTNLLVEDDVITSNINKRNAHELYESLLIIPEKKINLLKVNGNISWDTSSSSPTSISYLLKNAVTKDMQQVITGNVTFGKDIRAWAVISSLNVTNKIRDIISDAVIDCGESIEIVGKKLFDVDFVTDNLIVKSDLGVSEINGVNILKFNDSAVRKNREDIIASPLIFLKNIKIQKMYTNNTNLNASISNAVRFIDTLPDNVFFEELTVLGNIYLKNLDGINFDEFVNDRITLNGDHNISCDLKFNGLVTVTGNANINKINGISPFEFVFNGINDMQIISGIKIFKNDLIVNGDMIAPRINNIDMITEYAESVQNDEDVDIYGNLIFEEDVRIQEMNITGLVNNVDLRSVFSDLETKTNEIIQSLEQRENIIKQNVNYGFEVSEALHNIFLYLELEENLKIPSFINVTNVDVLYREQTTKLNIYSEQSGNLCGLPDDCPCLYQSEIIFNDGIAQIQQGDPGKIIKNFYNLDGTFDVSVTTNAVFSGKECISRIEEKFTKISLTKIRTRNPKQTVFTSNVLKGYWKDVTTFSYNGDLYILLVMYHDKTQATHHMSSLLYKTDMAKEEINLIQEMIINGAWSVQIFKISQSEIFLLIGCFSEFSKSLLYKFDTITEKFEQLRTFASRSRYVKSVLQGKNHFILLDDPDTNAVNIYKYDPATLNFYSYQSIFHNRQVNGIEFFYVDDLGNSDMFVIVTTEGGRFYIYEYMFAGKFQMRLQHTVNGLRTLVPFYYMGHYYIFAGTYGNNIIYRIVKQGLR